MKFFEDLTGTKLLGYFGAVAAASITATWVFCQKTQSDELQGFKAAQELHLKDAISSLSSYAEAAKLTSAERARLTALDGQVPALLKANADMKAQLDGVTRDRDSLKVTVNTMLRKNAELDVPIGETRWVVPNLVPIAVNSVNRSSVHMTFNGNFHILNAGEQLSFDLAGKRYIVTMTRIASDGAVFIVTLPDAG